MKSIVEEQYRRLRLTKYYILALALVVRATDGVSLYVAVVQCLIDWIYGQRYDIDCVCTGYRWVRHSWVS